MKKTPALLLFLAVFVFAFRSPARASGPGDSVIAGLMKNVPLWMTENHVPVTGVGLIENRRIKWIHVFGEIKAGMPAPENTLFNIASQTKPVTAMTVMKLVQNGDWKLDEPLAHFWIDPDIAGDSNLNKVTTRLVLSHQTGFPNWRTDNGGSKLTFIARPGTRFGYSGEGFEYLRRALENHFHTGLDKLADSLLFVPAGMKDSHYWRAGIDSSRFAHWHDGMGRRYAVSEQTPVSAADDLITSIGDYCRFGIYTMAGAGLSPKLFTEVVSDQVKTKDHYFRGLGWGLVRDLNGGGYALEHGGSDIGVRTMAIFLPESGSGIVVMTNADNGMFVYDKVIRLALAQGSGVLAIMNKTQQTHVAITVPASAIDAFTGTYVQENGKTMLVEAQPNALRISGDGLPTSLVYPETATRFFLSGYDVQLEFYPGNNGEPMQVAAFESGKQVMKMTRKPSSK